MSSELITYKVVYSGCDHDPAETSKGFCWQCRIKKLEAQVETVRGEVNVIVDSLWAQLDATGRRMVERGVRERDDGQRIKNYSDRLSEHLEQLQQALQESK